MFSRNSFPGYTSPVVETGVGILASDVSASPTCRSGPTHQNLALVSDRTLHPRARTPGLAGTRHTLPMPVQ